MKKLNLDEVFEAAKDSLDEPFDNPKNKQEALEYLKRSAGLNHYFGQTACAMQIEAVIRWLEGT